MANELDHPAPSGPAPRPAAPVASRDRGLRGWARAAVASELARLTADERILLALRLGLRDRRLAELAER